MSPEKALSVSVPGPPLTFYDEVEEFWSGAALALDGARVEAVVGDVHLRYLKAVLVFVADARHDGHAGVHRPLVVPREYDAGAVQPGSFRDPIQQVAPAAGKRRNTGCMTRTQEGTPLKLVSFDIEMLFLCRRQLWFIPSQSPSEIYGYKQTSSKYDLDAISGEMKVHLLNFCSF